MSDVNALLSKFPRVSLNSGSTPVQQLPRLSEKLGIDLWIKRDDLTDISLGGNKVRQLEFYFGEAIAKGSDTVLITGAVQSNYVRTAGTVASMLGMKAVLQLEERVKGKGRSYHSSGNILLGGLLGVENMSYPEGEDEAGADASLHERAAQLVREGRKPYVIHLGLNHPPLGALGYVRGAAELIKQLPDFDVAVVPSGSGATHGGFLTGLRLAKSKAPVFGACVRRDAEQQTHRIDTLTHKVAGLLGIGRPFDTTDIEISDEALAPGYGQMGQTTRDAVELMVRTEGILLDPVYSGKTFATLLLLLGQGEISRGQKVVLLHTGGQSALFAYQDELTRSSV